VIRFGVVLTVVLAAMGLLAGGVLANSLLLVYLAIGAAALAAIMLTVGVLIWREEVFGPTSAAKASPTAKRAAGPSPVLAATGVAQQGRSAGGRAADVATIGAAAAQDDFIAEPLLPALPPTPDWAGRLEPQGYPDWPAPPQQQEQPARLQHSGRPWGQQQPDRGRPPDRPEQPDWARRSDRPEPQEQPDQIKSSGQPEQQDRHQRSDRPGRQEEPDRANHSDRPERQQQPDSAKRSDRPEREEHLEPRRVAEPAGRQGSAGQERQSTSPSGPWPEPAAEPVPGPRQGEEAASAGVPPASRAASAADILKPSPAREPAAQSQGERDAGVSAWSFFARAAKPSVARPDLAQVASTGADEGRESAESGEPGRSREADESPKAARTAEVPPPDAARTAEVPPPDAARTAEVPPPDAARTAGVPPPDAARTAEVPPPDAARQPSTGTGEGEDRAAAGPVERDAHALPAEPEPVSAAAERAAAQGASPEAEDDSPADTAKGPATRDGHPARGPDTEVIVVPGITRYHRSLCILIRFLGPEDLETMTLQAAEMASYTPCKACRPEQVLADD
jgi:hypothetical protein